MMEYYSFKTDFKGLIGSNLPSLKPLHFIISLVMVSEAVLLDQHLNISDRPPGLVQRNTIGFHPKGAPAQTTMWTHVPSSLLL